MIVSRNACISCRGDGKCAECFGSGTNTHLNSDQPKCSNCLGTGICPGCEGTGYRHTAEILDLGLNE
jgi:hypothetical protein